MNEREKMLFPKSLQLNAFYSHEKNVWNGDINDVDLSWRIEALCENLARIYVEQEEKIELEFCYWQWTNS